MFLRNSAAMLLLIALLNISPVPAKESTDGPYVPPLTEWRAFPAFPVGSPAWSCATRQASGDWRVFQENFKVRVEPYSKQKKPLEGIEEAVRRGIGASWVQATFRTEEGLLVGINKGEWGGKLAWLPDDGETQDLLTDNIQALLPVPGDDRKVIVLHGLTHMTFSWGGLTLLEWTNNRWDLIDSFDLEAVPEAWTMDDSQRLWIATSLNLFRYDPGGQPEKILETRLTRLYISSIVVQPERVYLGMLHAVVRFDLDAEGGPREIWLVPPHCTRTIPNDDDRGCRCLAEEPLPEDFVAPPIEGPPLFPFLYDSRWLLLSLSLLVLGVCLWQIFRDRG